MSIAITTDTNSGITIAEGKRLGVGILPMPVLIDNACYFEGIDITHAQMYEAMKANLQTSTSQPSPGDVAKLWDSILKDGYDEIIHIPMTSHLSGSCQAAAPLAADYHGKVHVIDNDRISVTQRESVLEAKRMADAGRSASEIQEYLETSALDASIYLSVASLKYLQMGGRLSATSSMLGNVLNVKPILTIQGGKIEVFSKCRGMRLCERKMIEALKDDIERRFADVPAVNLRLAAAGSFQRLEDADRWLDTVRRAFPGMPVYYNPLPCSIVSHVGPDSLGVGVTVVRY